MNSLNPTELKAEDVEKRLSDLSQLSSNAAWQALMEDLKQQLAVQRAGLENEKDAHQVLRLQGSIRTLRDVTSWAEREASICRQILTEKQNPT